MSRCPICQRIPCKCFKKNPHKKLKDANMTEWTELNTLQDVAKAQADGWEIERLRTTADGNDAWCEWEGKYWGDTGRYRARPRQPKMKKVRMLCWYDAGRLHFVRDSWPAGKDWIRVPAQDIDIEIPENK